MIPSNASSDRSLSTNLSLETQPSPRPKKPATQEQVLLPAAETELGGQGLQAVLPDAPATLLKVPFGHGTQAPVSWYEPGEQSANPPVMFNRANPDLTPSQTSVSFGQTLSTRPLEA